MTQSPGRLAKYEYEFGSTMEFAENSKTTLNCATVNSNETEKGWATVNAANLHLVHWARWSWQGGTYPPEKPKKKKSREKKQMT